MKAAQNGKGSHADYKCMRCQDETNLTGVRHPDYHTPKRDSAGTSLTANLKEHLE